MPSVYVMTRLDPAQEEEDGVEIAHRNFGSGTAWNFGCGTRTAAAGAPSAGATASPSAVTATTAAVTLTSLARTVPPFSEPPAGLPFLPE